MLCDFSTSHERLLKGNRQTGDVQVMGVVTNMIKRDKIIRMSAGRTSQNHNIPEAVFLFTAILLLTM